MRYLVSMILTVLLMKGSIAQVKRANNWYFGKNAGLSFSLSPPAVLTNGAMNTLEGTASMSDTSGNLLFYTNGVNIWDRAHTIMPNGSGLMGNSSTAQNLAVPRPGSPDLYYIFYADEYGGPNGLRYSEVNMQLNGGQGDIVPATKNTLLHLNASEKIAGVNHCNDTNIWVLTINYSTDEFFAYLVTQTGIKPPVKSSCKPDAGYCCNSMKFSPDGKWLAHTSAIPSGGDDSQLYRFDNFTGIATFSTTLPRDIAAAEIPWGLSFSPDNSKLYISSGYHFDMGGVYTSLYQYDLSSANIPATKNAVLSQTFTGSGVSKYPFSELQNAPDGKIYMARWGMWTDLDTIAVINSPNQLGNNCNAVISAVPLSGKSSMIGLPNYVESYFNASPAGDRCPVVTTGLDGRPSQNPVSIDPNPVSDYFCIHNCIEGRLTLTDAFGNIWKRISVTGDNQKIYCNDLANGLYFLTLDSGGKQLTGKVVVVR